MNREKLLEQLTSIRKQEEEISKQIDAIDYEERLNDAKQYEGRYFKDVSTNNKEYIRCLFVYGTDEKNCTPNSLCVNYWENNEEYHFKIEDYDYFRPKHFDEDIDKWIEISKEEFQQHYNEVQRRISSVVSKKK
jgi:hypothetical protein